MKTWSMQKIQTWAQFFYNSRIYNYDIYFDIKTKYHDNLIFSTIWNFSNFSAKSVQNQKS